jgi:hypothetical protein
MSTTVLQQFKVTALPGTLVANSIYYVTVSGKPDLVEIYVVNSAGTAARHVLNEADVAVMISSAMNGGNQLTIVNDIAARNALLPLTVAKWVYVVNATGDATVAAGGATYLYNPTTLAWVKAGESESMDLVLSWANLTGKPTSSVAAIDAAVAASHTHANKATLDLVTASGGNLLYNGALPVSRWESAAW